MVVLNATIVIQLGLFLLFLLGMHLFILRPTLRVMDERSAAIARDKQAAQTDTTDAQQLEARYAAEVQTARRAAALEAAQAHRAAQEEHLAALNQRHREADPIVAAARRAALDEVEAQRRHYAQLTPEIAQAVAERLGFGGKGDGA